MTKLACALHEIQTISTLPENFSDTSYTADVHVHPSGRFLYGSNRGHDSIAIFEIDEVTGKLSAVGHEPTQGRNASEFWDCPIRNVPTCCQSG